jgi:uncharacterized protein
MLQAVGAKSAAAIGELMAPDATWWVVGSGDRETTAAPRGPFLDSIEERLDQLFAGPVSFTVKGITAEGDRVAVEADSSAQLTNGKTYANMYHFLFTFTPDGKITAVREYNDTAYMRASFAG